MIAPIVSTNILISCHSFHRCLLLCFWSFHDQSDLYVRSVDSGGYGLNKDRAVADVGLRYVFISDRAGLSKFYGDRFQVVTSYPGSLAIIFIG
jgi:hypothetical protein